MNEMLLSLLENEIQRKSAAGESVDELMMIKVAYLIQAQNAGRYIKLTNAHQNSEVFIARRSPDGKHEQLNKRQADYLIDRTMR